MRGWWNRRNCLQKLKLMPPETELEKARRRLIQSSSMYWAATQFVKESDGAPNSEGYNKFLADLCEVKKQELLSAALSYMDVATTIA